MTPAEFLREKARLFSCGDLVACAEMFDAPTVMTFGEQGLHAPDRSAIVAAFEIYRANLLVESYEQTLVDVPYTSDLVGGRVNALAQWKNMSIRGALIGRMEANYILRSCAETGWRVVSAEFLDAGKARLMAGVSLV